MKIKNKFYHFIVSIILVVSLLAGTIVPANTIVKADDNNPTIWTSYEQSNGVVTIHLSSYQMLIKYDNEKLSYKECKFSSELGSTITSAKESQGTVKIALINGNGLSVSDKELFAITYTADFVGSEQCVFNTNINEAYDRNLSNIDFNIDSQLTINVDNPLSDNYQVNLEGTTDANANDTVQCRFGFSRNAGVMSGSFILHYNEEQVRFQKVTANKNVEGLIVSYNKVEEGTVKVAYAFNKCSTTTMNFLNMEFIPLEKSTSSNISLSDVTITNEQLQECTFDGSYEATISTSEQQSDNLFTVNGLDSIDSQETFDVTINLAGNSGIASMTAYLEYDKDIFEIQDASFSDGILKNSFTNVSTSTKGKVKFAFMSTDDIKADGQVIKLTFKAIKNENVSGKFQLVVDELTDSNATKQEYNIADLTTKVNKICIHNYIGPDFQWSDDYSICKAVYTCEYNSEHVIKVDCDVETNITHTATGTYNDQKITDVQKETIPAKGHVKGEVKIENATEATCEVGGSYDEVIYCTVCGKELSRTTIKTEAKGHKWNEGKVTKEPTCTEEGVKTFECTVCGKTKTEKVEALGHDWDNDFTVDKEATCEETGLKSIHCKRCDSKKDETVIPAKGHVAGEKKIENATEAVCEAGGSYDEVVYCTVCNKEISRTTIKTEAKGHKWNEGKVTTEPTCTEEGVKTFECTVCGKTKTEKVEALGHDWNEDFTVDKEATCEETGLKSIHCKRCDSKKDETVIPAKGHVAGEKKIENATEAVCEAGGSYDEVVYCTVCNKEISRKTIKTEAKGHKWDSGKITKEPTYTEQGTRTYTCTVCGKTKTETVNVLKEEYNVGSTYEDATTNAIYRVIVPNQQVEYVCPIDKKLKKATIPSQIKIGNVTYKVTAIGGNAFKKCKNLTSITIEKNVSKIGSKAFYNCKKLKNIKIKSKKLTLKKVGKSAFKSINKKAKITVPKSKKKSYKKILVKRGLSKKAKIK